MNIEDPLTLTEYLAARGHPCSGRDNLFRILTGGVSNAAVVIRLEDGQVLVLKKALPKLRTKVEWFSPVTRIHREAAGMRALAKILPAECVPQLVFEDHENHIIAMTAVPEPHENFKEVLLAGRVENEAIRQFATMLGTIHRRGADDAEPFRIDFADRSFFESLRMEPYYAFAGREVPQAQTFLAALIEQTMQRKMTLVHGDYSPKNILIHAGKLVLLDHEVIHFGDPSFDAGFALTHLLSKAHHLPASRAQLRDASLLFWKTYCAALDEKAICTFETLPQYEQRCVNHLLACLLARVAGRSILEYLSEIEQQRQARIVLDLIARAPARISELIDEFIGRIDSI